MLLFAGLNFLRARKEERERKLLMPEEESHSLSVVRAVNGRSSLYCEAESLISEAQQLLAQHPNISLVHCKRDANFFFLVGIRICITNRQKDYKRSLHRYIK